MMIILKKVFGLIRAVHLLDINEYMWVSCLVLNHNILVLSCLFQCHYRGNENLIWPQVTL